MKQKDQTDNLNISQGPLPGSTKIYVTGSRPDIRVPMRRIALSDTIDEEGVRHNNVSVVVYDTSGPYTDPDYHVDPTKGYLRYASSGSRSVATRRDYLSRARSMVASGDKTLRWIICALPISTTSHS